jgi:hypothetical protein
MALTQSQKATLAKAQAVGAGPQGVALSNGACSYLVGTIARDLGCLDRFPELPSELPPFFGTRPLSGLAVPGFDHVLLFERLVANIRDGDTYFHCLATLHKARLKYERILETQPLPTIEQVGPRGLLQYGSLERVMNCSPLASVV